MWIERRDHKKLQAFMAGQELDSDPDHRPNVGLFDGDGEPNLGRCFFLGISSWVLATILGFDH